MAFINSTYLVKCLTPSRFDGCSGGLPPLPPPPDSQRPCFYTCITNNYTHLSDSSLVPQFHHPHTVSWEATPTPNRCPQIWVKWQQKPLKKSLPGYPSCPHPQGLIQKPEDYPLLAHEIATPPTTTAPSDSHLAPMEWLHPSFSSSITPNKALLPPGLHPSQANATTVLASLVQLKLTPINALGLKHYS